MKNLAEAKRAVTVGTNVMITDHWFPRHNGLRTVLYTQSNAIYLTLPVDHPDHDTSADDRTWMDWPKASELTFNADGSISFKNRLHWTLAVVDDD